MVFASVLILVCMCLIPKTVALSCLASIFTILKKNFWLQVKIQLSSLEHHTKSLLKSHLTSFRINTAFSKFSFFLSVFDCCLPPLSFCLSVCLSVCLSLSLSSLSPSLPNAVSNWNRIHYSGASGRRSVDATAVDHHCLRDAPPDPDAGEKQNELRSQPQQQGSEGNFIPPWHYCNELAIAGLPPQGFHFTGGRRCISAFRRHARAYDPHRLPQVQIGSRFWAGCWRYCCWIAAFAVMDDVTLWPDANFWGVGARKTFTDGSTSIERLSTRSFKTLEYERVQFLAVSWFFIFFLLQQTCTSFPCVEHIVRLCVCTLCMCVLHQFLATPCVLYHRILVYLNLQTSLHLCSHLFRPIVFYRRMQCFCLLHVRIYIHTSIYLLSICALHGDFQRRMYWRKENEASSFERLKDTCGKAHCSCCQFVHYIETIILYWTKINEVCGKLRTPDQFLHCSWCWVEVEDNP